MITKTLISLILLFMEIFIILLVCSTIFIILFILINFIKYKRKKNDIWKSFYNWIKHSLYKYLKIIWLSLMSFILIFIVFFSLWNLYLHYTKINTEKIDTSFFTEQIKNDILNIERNINNTKDFDSIIVDYYRITYYKSESNPLKKDIPLDIKEVMKKNNISYININWILSEIYVNFTNNNFVYMYTNSYKYKNWDMLISWLMGKIEKVIDDNWYVVKLCGDRDMCP